MSYDPRACVHCGETYVPTGRAQRYCTRGCAHRAASEQRLEVRRTGGLVNSLLAPDMPRPMRVVPVLVHDEDGVAVGKECARCGDEFPIERNSRGQVTTRALCGECRTKRANNNSVGGDVPRCRECRCVLGEEYGGAEHAGGDICTPCLEWAARMAARPTYRLRGR